MLSSRRGLREPTGRSEVPPEKENCRSGHIRSFLTYPWRLHRSPSRKRPCLSFVAGKPCNLAITSATVFAFAGVLSAFNQRWRTVAGLAATVMSWPELALLVSSVLRADLFWYVRYRPDSVAAILSLTVATIYSINHVRLLLRGGRESERGMTLQLVSALLYGAATLGTRELACHLGAVVQDSLWRLVT
jgi:hypothetical protein